MTNETTPAPAMWPEDTECPVRAGDEVGLCHAPPDTLGRVARVYTEDALTKCTLEIRGGTTYLAYPWELDPADDTVDPVDWDLRMARFLTVQRERVLYRMLEQQRDILHRVIALTKQATAIIHELCAGRTPGPPGHSPMEFTATGLDEELRRMAEYRETVVDSGLFAPDDLKVQLAIETTEPTPAPPRPQTAEVPRTSPPPADRIAEADRLHADIRDRRRDMAQLYTTLCTKYGLDPDDPGHRDNDPAFDVAYLQQRDDLHGDIASATEKLIDLIEAGGPLPTAWTRGHA
ncbi:hypothetical protein [Nocardia thraciensis]